MELRLTKEIVSSPETRRELPTMDYPRWVEIEKGKHLGFCRGVTVSSWFVRLRLKEHKYRQSRLGSADDHLKADGAEILSYAQAVDQARQWCDDHENISMEPVRAYECADRFPVLPPSPPYTVAHAMVDFMRWYEKNRRGIRTIYYDARTHIIPKLGDIAIVSLNSRTIRLWLDELSETPARLRSGRNGKVNYRPYPNDPEIRRMRQNSVNRTLRVLKAALNRAYEYGYADNPSAWQRVRPFRGVNRARLRYLTLAQCAALVAACPAPLRDLVSGALLTGCRVGELRTMRVEDYNQDLQRIFVRDGKGRKQRHVSLSREGTAFFSGLVTGRGPQDHMFLRGDGTPWTTYTHIRQFHNVCVSIGIDPPMNFHALRHTYATQLAMAGVPFEVLAKQLGHKDTRMVQRHYAHLGNSFVDEIIQARMPRFL